MHFLVFEEFSCRIVLMLRRQHSPPSDHEQLATEWHCANRSTRRADCASTLLKNRPQPRANKSINKQSRICKICSVWENAHLNQLQPKIVIKTESRVIWSASTHISQYTTCIRTHQIHFKRFTNTHQGIENDGHKWISESSNERFFNSLPSCNSKAKFKANCEYRASSK